MITLKDKKTLTYSYETHYKFDVNGKEIHVLRWVTTDNNTFDSGTEIFKGEKLLTQEEFDEVMDYVNEEPKGV